MDIKRIWERALFTEWETINKKSCENNENQLRYIRIPNNLHFMIIYSMKNYT